MNNSTADGIASLAIGAYLLAAVVKGRRPQLWAQLKSDAGFIKWGIAVSIIWWVSQRKELGNLGPMLITVAVVGVAFKIATDPTIIKSIQSAWASLPSGASISPSTLQSGGGGSFQGNGASGSF